VPSEEGLGPDQERAPRLPPKEPARGGKERLVGCAVDRSLHLPAQDCDLVSQHGDLDLRLGRCPIVGMDQAEDAAQEKIEERADHGAALSQTGPPLPVSGPRSSFWTRRVLAAADPDPAGRGRRQPRHGGRSELEAAPAESPLPGSPFGTNCVSSSIVETLKDFFGTNQMSFSATHATLGITRSFTHFSEAITEIRLARVYGGIHFMTADAEAVALGKQVARYREAHYFRPIQA